MGVIEVQFDGGESEKKECDLCNEEPENGVLIEKPNSIIVNGRLILSQRKVRIHICMDCLTFDVENMQ